MSSDEEYEDGCCGPLGFNLCNSELNIVQANSKYATAYSDTRKSNPPIKIIDKTINTPTEAAVNGNGISAVIVAMLYI